MKKIEEKINYIQAILYFIFPESDLNAEDFPNTESIDRFANMAALFSKTCPFTHTYTNEQLEDIFSLIQDLYTEYWATIKLGQDTDSIDLSEIGLGFDFDINKYQEILESALSMLNQYGLEIYESK